VSRLYKRSDSPHWYYSFGTPPFRKRQSTKTDSLRLARLIQQKWDEELILANRGIAAKRILVPNLIDRYIEHLRRLKNESWYLRQKGGLKHLSRLFPNYQVREISYTEIRHYIRIRKEEGVSPKTIREEVSMISRFFLYAIKDSYALSNPAEGADLPAKRKIKPRTAISSEELSRTVREAEREDDRIYWSLLYYSGLRTGDAGSLTNKDIQNDRIDIVQQKTSRRVIIPLHRKLKKFNLVSLMPTRGKRRWSRHRFQKILGYGDLHSIRHSFGTHLIEKGATTFDVKALLGHKSADVTSEYIHQNFARLKKIINLL